jgi:PAS domain S-box-containing protein
MTVLAMSLVAAVVFLLVALGALLVRSRMAAAARAAEMDAATSLAEAVAGMATTTAFTLQVDRDGRYTTRQVLGALHAWLGYEDDETSPREAWRRLVHPDDRGIVEQALRSALAGEPAGGDVRYVPARGEPRRLRLGLRPARDRLGWVRTVHGVLREPPERPDLEAALRASEARLREAGERASAAALLERVLGDAPAAVVCSDGLFRLVRVNAAGAALLGAGAGSLVGREFAEAAPDVWRELGPQFQGVLERGTPVTEVALRLPAHAGDEPRTYLVDVFPLRAGDGGIAGVAAFASDISRRDRVQRGLDALVERLHVESRKKDEQLAALAAELTGRSARDEALVRRARDAIGRPMGRVMHLIDDLLDASRIARGELVLRRERVALQEVLGQALEARRARGVGTEPEVQLVAPDAPIWLVADPARLAHAFTLLLDDGGAAPDAGARPRVVVSRDAGSASVCLHRAGDADAGLVLARGLVERHGGAVEVTKDAVSEATVRVTLPLAAAMDAEAAREPA